MGNYTAITSLSALSAHPSDIFRKVEAPLNDEEVIDERYRIIEEIGNGSFGVVYRVEDLELEEDFALKLVHVGGVGEAKELVKSLLQEYKVRLKIKNFAHVINTNEPRRISIGSEQYVVMTMQFGDGGNFRDWLDEASEEERHEEGLKHFYDICLGVRELHANDIAHLDLKPENVVFHDGIVKIVDLGISRFVGNNYRQNLNHLLANDIGTPKYMSPEQLEADQEIGTASDIYSLGIMLYELIAGEVPFDGDPHEIYEAQRGEEANEIDDLNHDLWCIIEKCLEKNPNLRFDDIDELIEAFEPFVEGDKAVLIDYEAKKAAAREYLGKARSLIPMAKFDAAQDAVEMARMEYPMLDEIEEVGKEIDEISTQYREALELAKTHYSVREFFEAKNKYESALGICPKAEEPSVNRDKILEMKERADRLGEEFRDSIRAADFSEAEEKIHELDSFWYLKWGIKFREELQEKSKFFSENIAFLRQGIDSGIYSKHLDDIVDMLIEDFPRCEKLYGLKAEIETLRLNDDYKVDVSIIDDHNFTYTDNRGNQYRWRKMGFFESIALEDKPVIVAITLVVAIVIVVLYSFITNGNFPFLHAHPMVNWGGLFLLSSTAGTLITKANGNRRDISEIALVYFFNIFVVMIVFTVLIYLSVNFILVRAWPEMFPEKEGFFKVMKGGVYLSSALSVFYMVGSCFKLFEDM